VRAGRIILVASALAATLLLASLTWLAGTEAGLRFLLARASTVIPGTLEVGTVQGRLVGPMVFRDVRWTLDDQGGSARRIELDWQPLALLQREIHLDRLELLDVEVTLPPADTETVREGAPAADWREVTVPWGLVVDELSIEGARLHRGEALLGEITTLRGALHLQDRSLALDALEFSSPQGSAGGRLAASLDPREEWDVALAWDARLPDFPLAGETRITGTLRDLDLQQVFSQPAAAVVSGRLRGLPATPDWDLRIELQPLPAETGPWPDALDGAFARLDITGSLEATRLQGDIGWPLLLAAPAGLDATLGWRDAVVVLDAVTITLAQASRLDLRGRVVPGTVPEVDLQGRATGITWPLHGEETLVTLPLLEFDGASQGSAWQLSATGEVAPSDLPAAQLDFSARGDATSLHFDKLNIQALGGTVTGTGSAAWADHPVADLLLQFSDLDPAHLAAAWPGSIAGTVHLHGSQAPGRRFHVDGRDIVGTLRAQPLAGAFQMALAPDAVELTQASLALGSASLEASGSLKGDQITLSARLDAPRLEELGPEFTGRISARAQVAGPRSAPVIELEADGGRLSWGKLRARVLEADARVDMSGNDRSTVRAELAGIAASVGRGATLRLEASGHPTDHTMQLEFTRRRPEQAVVLALAGKLEARHWSGQLEDLSIAESQQELWRLQAPATLSASPQHLQLGQACMDGILGLLCLAAERPATGPWLGEAELGRLDLGPLSEWLGMGLTARGELTGAARVLATDDRFVELDGAFNLSTGDIRRRDRRDVTVLSWSRGEFTLSGDADAAEARLNLALADDNMVQGQIRLGWNEPDPWVQGMLEAELDRLTLVTELVPELSALGGEVGIRLALDGTLARPAPSGRLEWRDGNAAVPELGLAPEDIQLQAEIAQGNLEFRATGKSGEGRFETRGRFDLRGAGVNGRASLQGTNLTVANLPDATVVADPDLRLSFRGQRLNLGGSVHIPSAMISGLGSSAAVRTSPDEVIVGRRARGADEEEVEVSSRIEVSAGPAVQLQIGGFSGRVEGSVLTVLQPQTDPWGRGELRVVDGEMSVLGQTLEIQTGRLIYDGGPLENPMLEIRAVRQVRDVTAGALVRGTAEQPQISIFSEPAMSNAEALSYLTLGKSLEQVQSGERQSMNQAANALALSGGGLVMQDFARRLGFEDLEVSAETGDDGSALVVSKYLGGGLYVSYGLGLFDTVNTLRLRYQVNRRLSLEAESGEEASADLFYSFERK
jgi:translocation and assembly module TamB